MFWMKNKKAIFLLGTLNKKFQRKIVNILLPIILAYVLGAQKNRLIETVLLSTLNMFWLKNKKVIFLLRTFNKNFHRKIINIFLPIIYSICFGCSKEQSH